MANWKKYQIHLETLFVFLLAASVRLTSLNVFRAVDEEDRWAWAVDFYQALLARDLRGTLVGDGYPGIFPVWLETIWLFLASLYRSVLQGRWLGDDGVYLLIHQWSRTTNLDLQRFPVVLTNTLLVVLIFFYLRKLFGQRIALLSTVFISLDPFFLSDSRVNRAEGLLTGLMMISLLALIAAHRQSAPTHESQYEPGFITNNEDMEPPKYTLTLLGKNWRHLLISALFSGLALLTKSQALVLVPMLTVITFIWHLHVETHIFVALRRWVIIMSVWVLVAVATFFVLWPATWTVPGPTFTLMFNYATRKVGEEGVKLFFLGKTLLDEDAGLLFYPVIFILRATPVMLFGLLLGLWLLTRQKWELSIAKWRSWLDNAGIWAVLAYTLLYVGGMSLGSHKQDRFLMSAFPTLYVLAAVAFVHFAEQRDWASQWVWLGGCALFAVQLATALPFHPYYFSYFNPLVGGGPVATRLTRIGWGEGMDQAGAYLQSLDNADSLVVASRFSGYLLGFKGDTLNLDEDGEWVNADKIVFYIQQSQRMLDPSPGVIRYFQEHVSPEKVITIDNVDYAKIYPNPVQFPANPEVDRIDDELRLLGYRWETKKPDISVTLHLIWENLSSHANPIGIRLWATQDSHGSWLPCTAMPGFETSAQTPGEVVESACHLSGDNLAPGLYDLQVGMQQPDGVWLVVDFAAGWSAAELATNGTLQRVTPEVAFARLADEAIPASAARIEHTYHDDIRLLAYELDPERLQPGQSLTVTLYWQTARVLEQDVDVSLQLFVREDERIALVNGPPLGGHSTRPTSSWRPGEVIQDVWTIDIPAETPAPALLRLDVGLFLPETLIPLPVRNQAGEDIPAAIAEVRLEPETWPTYQGDHPLNFIFDESIGLIGYETTPIEGNTLGVTLYWNALNPPKESDTVFLHLLDSEGKLVAQSDVLPAQGLFPTSVWQPGDIVLSWHQLNLPDGLPPGEYTMLAGLYRSPDNIRLPVLDSKGEPLSNHAAPIDRISLP